MAQTTTRTNGRQQQAMPPPQNAVAVLAPPRLAPPEQNALVEYGVNAQGWRTLVESIFPAAKTAMAVMMALDYCQRRKLDVFKHPVHIVPIWNQSVGERGAYVETIWPGINELRTTAIRTGQFAGLDVPVFGPMITTKFEGRIKKWQNGSASWEKVEATVTFPEWCQITVYRTLGGNRVPFPGPRVYWLETYARIRNDCDVPNSMWEKRANGQIEKCAEAAALRRAFPEEIGSDYSIDEIGAFTTHAPADVTDQGSVTVSAAEPKREDYQSQPDVTRQAESGQPVDSPVTGAGGDSKPEAASTPANITDVEELPVDEFGPARPRPGEQLEFQRYSKVAEFCDFADHFLGDTNQEGAAQFEAFYQGTLVAMEKGKPGSQEAAKMYRDTLAAFKGDRQPGEEG